MLTHRELSAQEAAYRLCHLPLKENSRKVVFLNSARPEKRTRLLKNRSDLLQLEDDSSDIFIPGIFDRYASRPNTAEFEAMTFAHFAVWYNLDTTRGDASKPTSGRQPRAIAKWSWLGSFEEKAGLSPYPSSNFRESR